MLVEQSSDVGLGLVEAEGFQRGDQLVQIDVVVFVGVEEFKLPRLSVLGGFTKSSVSMSSPPPRFPPAARPSAQ